MAKTLLDILNGPFPKPVKKTPNEEGMTPLPQETAARAFLKTLPIQAHPDPYGNEDAFSAKDVSVFQRAKNNYGYDYKTQGDFNNQQSTKNVHVLRNPTLNVSTEEAFVAVDSVGLGSRTAWRVVNKLTNEYITRSIQKEDAERIADELNARFNQELLSETKKGERTSKKFIGSIDTNEKGEPKDAHAHGIKAVSKALFPKGELKYRGGKKKYWGGGSSKAGANRADIYDRSNRFRNEEIEELDESVTRKHFREVANTVRAIEHPGSRQEYADHHADIFAKQNPRFDHSKFHAACGTKTKKERGIREETQLDELSDGTLKRYYKSAKDSKQSMEYASGFRRKLGLDTKGVDREASKRKLGMKRAAHKVMNREEIENLNEISRKTLGSYIRGAHQEAGLSDFQHGKVYGKELATKRRNKVDQGVASKAAKISIKRGKGIINATKKLTGTARVNSEGIHYLSDILEGWAEKAVSRIYHGYKSTKNKDTPRRGKSYAGSINLDPKTGHPAGPEDRAMRAIADLKPGRTRLKYRSGPNKNRRFGDTQKAGASGADIYKDKSWWRGNKRHTVESEQLDELSKKTLGSYIKKAAGDPQKKSLATLGDTGTKGSKRNAEIDKWNSRFSGVTLAVNKITNKKPTKQKGKINPYLERPNSARVLAGK